MIGICRQNEPDIDELRRLYPLIALDPNVAIAGFESLAERGSAASMLYLADMFMGRNSMPKAAGKAKYWYERAAKHGIAQASHMLGQMFFDEKHYERAFCEFSDGMRAGYSPSMYRLAMMYRRGNGVKINNEKCADLLGAAAAKGHIFAKRDLATLYLTGAFGWRLLLRGFVMLLLSLPKDLVLLKTVDPGSELDERIVC